MAAGLFVGVGARYEDERHAGVTHLLEHLVFKGTLTHPGPGELSAAIESVGGSVNAGTDHEVTMLSTRVPARHAEYALDVLAQMAFRPLLRRSDLLAERPVIVDEIRSYEDSPSDHVFTLFDAHLFGSHPLGREIAGSPASLRRITHRAVLDHWSRWYRPDNVVLAAAGAVDHETVVGWAGGWWQGDEGAKPQPRPTVLQAPVPAPPGSVSVHHRGLAQGHVCIGMPGISRTDPDRWALELLLAVLGDGQSSRLFVEIRDKRSLAYEVSTFSAMFSDCGVVGVYAAFDPERAGDVVRAVLEQLERAVQESVPPDELEKARAYAIGRIELRMEETGPVAGWLGHGELLLPRLLTPDEVIEQLRAQTADDLLRVARRYVAPNAVRLTALGPFRGSGRFDRLIAA